jgi:hypothetical protein
LFIWIGLACFFDIVTGQSAPDSATVLKIRDGITKNSVKNNSLESLQLPGTYRQLLRQHPFFNFFASPVIHTSSLRAFNGKDELFYLLIGFFFLLAFTRVAYTKYVSDMMTVFFSVSLKQKQLREQLMQSPIPSFFLNLLFVGVIALYITFLVQHSTGWKEQYSFWQLFFYSMAIIVCIYLAKHIVLKLAGWVFGISPATELYIFIVFLVNKLLGILFLPVVAVMAFASKSWWSVLSPISYILLGALFIYRYAVSYGPVRKELKVSQFHFFLYLCAFEILPMVLICREFSGYFE